MGAISCFEYIWIQAAPQPSHLATDTWNPQYGVNSERVHTRSDGPPHRPGTRTSLSSPSRSNRKYHKFFVIDLKCYSLTTYLPRDLVRTCVDSLAQPSICTLVPAMQRVGDFWDRNSTPFWLFLVTWHCLHRPDDSQYDQIQSLPPCTT